MPSPARPLVVAVDSPDALVERMASLAEPTRLRLLRLLEKHELGVADLVDIVQMPQSTVSRHLKVLADQGWVQARAHRTNNLYRMAEALDDAGRRLWHWARESTQAWPSSRHDALRLERRLAARPPAPAFFSGAAGRWDRLRSELYGRAFQQEALLALLPGRWVVADLGCGTGAVTAALAPHVKRVVGVDQSAAMLKAAQRRTAGVPNVEFQRGDLEDLPLPSAGCDAALLILVLTYVADPVAVLGEAARILVPGGRLAVVDILRHDREEFRREMGQVRLGFEPEALEAPLREAGLEDVRCRPLPPEPRAKGPALLLATATRADGRQPGAEPPAERQLPPPRGEGGVGGARAGNRRQRPPGE